MSLIGKKKLSFFFLKFHKIPSGIDGMKQFPESNINISDYSHYTTVIS